MCKGGLTLIDKIPSKAVADKYFSEYGIDLPILDCSPLLNEIFYYQCDKCSLFQYDKSWIGNGKFYEALQEKNWYYLENKSEFLIAYKYINTNDSVCEIGCGNGKFATGIPAYVKYKGYELNLKALNQARKKGLNVIDIDFINNSHAEKSSYDICVAFQVLEHVEEPNFLLSAMVETTKRGGLIIISVPSEDSFLKYDFDNITNMPPHHLTRWTDRALINVCENFNIDVIEINHEKLTPSHYAAWSIAKVKYIMYFILKIPKVNFINSKIIKWALKLLSIPFRFLLHFKVIQPIGHTVTMVYRKK
jgi:SAM-dependent methyltransferase